MPAAKTAFLLSVTLAKCVSTDVISDVCVHMCVPVCVHVTTVIVTEKEPQVTGYCIRYGRSCSERKQALPPSTSFPHLEAATNHLWCRENHLKRAEANLLTYCVSYTSQSHRNTRNLPRSPPP